jgi:hypothetical protein
MKLRRESAENGDFSGPKGEFKNRFLGLQSYRDTFRSENRFLSRKSAVIVARSSWLHEICGLAHQPLNEGQRFARVAKCTLGVFLGVEFTWSKILCPIESQFPIPA